MSVPREGSYRGFLQGRARRLPGRKTTRDNGTRRWPGRRLAFPEVTRACQPVAKSTACSGVAASQAGEIESERVATFLRTVISFLGLD